MKCKLKVNAANPNGTMMMGQVYDLPSKVAQSFIKGGYAEPVESGNPKQSNPVSDEADEADQPKQSGKSGRS